MLGISVAMPIHRCHPNLDRAIASVLAQELDGELDLMLVVNGDDPAAAASAKAWSARDGRIRVLHHARASLSAALNLALREARFDLVARMDDDDACPATRLAIQGEHLLGDPSLAAVGCAWELVQPDGAVQVQRPPTEARALRSRLLLGNCLAHGSMMLRRGAVLEAGGYDESLERAQDYDLWLRLSRGLGLASVEQVLYRYHAPGAGACSSPAQALSAGGAMLRAWRELGEGDEDALAEIVSLALRSEAPARSARDLLASMCEQGPTRGTLLLRLWMDWLHPPMDREAIEVCRRARLREIGTMLRDRGVSEIWLFGAGNHGAWVLDHRDDLGLAILGVVDDAVASERWWGLCVRSPQELSPGETVLIASDTFEREIWQRSAALRERGVEVVRLYGEEACAISPAGAC